MAAVLDYGFITGQLDKPLGLGQLALLPLITLVVALTGGHFKRSNEVIFAHVGSNTFDVLGVFDHSVFDDESHTMTPERERLWHLHELFMTEGLPAGAFVMAN